MPLYRAIVGGVTDHGDLTGLLGLDHPQYGLVASSSVRVFHSQAQNAPSFVDTILTFDSERWDPELMHNPILNPSRLTCLIPGKYLVICNVQWATGGSVGVRQLAVLVNGVAVMARAQVAGVPSGIGTEATQQEIVVLLDLSLGDFVEIIVRQTSATNPIPVGPSTGHQCEFSMARLSI